MNYLAQSTGMMFASSLRFQSLSSLGISCPAKPLRRLFTASTDMVFLVLYVALPMCGKITAGTETLNELYNKENYTFSDG